MSEIKTGSVRRGRRSQFPEDYHKKCQSALLPQALACRLQISRRIILDLYYITISLSIEQTFRDGNYLNSIMSFSEYSGLFSPSTRPHCDGGTIGDLVSDTENERIELKAHRSTSLLGRFLLLRPFHKTSEMFAENNLYTRCFLLAIYFYPDWQMKINAKAKLRK